MMIVFVNTYDYMINTHIHTKIYMCKYIDLSFSRECKSFLLHVRKTKGLTVRVLKELS